MKNKAIVPKLKMEKGVIFLLIVALADQAHASWTNRTKAETKTEANKRNLNAKAIQLDNRNGTNEIKPLYDGRLIFRDYDENTSREVPTTTEADNTFSVADRVTTGSDEICKPGDKKINGKCHTVVQ